MAVTETSTVGDYQPIILTDPRPEGEHLWGRRTAEGIDMAVNLHTHTTASDGVATTEQLGRISQEHSLNIAHTDHNCIDTIEQDPSGYIGRIAGMEITTHEGIDVVTVGTKHRIADLFEDVVRPELAGGKHWRLRPTRLPILDLMEEVREKGIWIIHPHYTSVDGLSRLPHHEQIEVLDQSRGRCFIELNALRQKYENAASRSLAQQSNIPIVATSDAHAVFPTQYTSSYTCAHMPRFTHNKTDGTAPIETLLQFMHDHQENCDHILTPPTFSERLETARQIHSKMPPWFTLWYGLKLGVSGMGFRLATLIRTHHRQKKINRALRSPLKKRRREDEVDEDGS